MLTASGLEGGAVYALSARLRDAITAEGSAMIVVDLRPDLSRPRWRTRLGGPRRSQSLANTLRKQAGLSPEASGLVQEALHSGASAEDLAGLIKVAADPACRAGVDRAGDLRPPAGCGRRLGRVD